MSLDRFNEWMTYFRVKDDYRKWADKRAKRGLPTDVGFFYTR